MIVTVQQVNLSAVSTDKLLSHCLGWKLSNASQQQPDSEVLLVICGLQFQCFTSQAMKALTGWEWICKQPFVMWTLPAPCSPGLHQGWYLPHREFPHFQE